MSKSYKLAESMFLQPIFEHKHQRQDFTNIVLKGDRYLSFLKDIDKLSTKDIKQISSDKHQLPKLQTVISCGHGKVLPEIIEMFYPNQQKQIKKELSRKQSRKERWQLPEISSRKKVKDMLLTQCAKKDSFFEFKKNKNKMLSEKKDSRRRIRTLPNSPPQELRTLKLKHLSSIRNSKQNKSCLTKIEREITPFQTVESQEDSEAYDMLQHLSVPSKMKKSFGFQEIMENYKSASEYDFPPLKLFKVLKCLDKSSKLVEREMEQDVIQEEKVNFDKKFDKLLENQHLSYKKHLNQFKEHNKARRRLE